VPGTLFPIRRRSRASIVVRSVACGGALLALGAGAAGCGSPSAAAAPTSGCGTSDPQLTVQGTGVANTTPDLLTVVVGVDVTGSDAQQALAADGARTNAAVAALGGAGVAAKDIQTANLQLQPRVDSSGQITGYDATNTVVAKVRDLSKAGVVVDAATAAAGGAVRIDSLSFSVDDPRQLEDQARADAVTQAATHAAAMARAAGDRLGRICRLSDSQSPMVPLAFGPGANAANVAAPTPLEPGTATVSAQVTIVYALDPPVPTSSPRHPGGGR